MVFTTPHDKADKHKSWHRFARGGCAYCGWHCEDCPKGVATCKCVQRADGLLKQENSGISDSWYEEG